VAVKAFYGFRQYLRTSLCVVILACQSATADATEAEMIWEVAPTPPGMMLEDRNSWSPALKAEFRAAGGRLLAPFKTRRLDPRTTAAARLQRAKAADRDRQRPTGRVVPCCLPAAGTSGPRISGT
jgi:hypothetical protein